MAGPLAERAATPDTTALLHHLQTEASKVSHFISLLEKEADILATGARPDELNQITTEKEQAADKLSIQAEYRNALLGAMGYENGHTGLIAVAQNHPQLLDTIHTLLDSIEQARLLNLGNGQIIERFLRHHGQALQVLHHLTGRSQLYDAQGRTRPTTSPRTGHNKSA